MDVWIAMSPSAFSNNQKNLYLKFFTLFIYCVAHVLFLLYNLLLEFL